MGKKARRDIFMNEGGGYEYPADGLVAEWLFHGNANDTSGEGHDGTVVGPTLTDDRFGEANRAYLFDKVDDYIFSEPVSIAAGGDMSMVSWVWSTDFVANMFILSKVPVNTQWGMFFDAFNRGVFLRGGGGTAVDTSGHVPIYPTNNAWHLIISTIQGTAGKIYVDGDIWASGTVDAIANGLTPGVNDVLIGQYAKTPGSFPFGGVEDDCLLYNKAFTPTEITNIYNGSKP